MASKRVLIVGGGFAGLSAARELNGTMDVAVVDPKTYFEHVPNAAHSFVDAACAAKSLVAFPQGTGVTHKQGLVVALSTDGAKGEATLQDGEKLSFDYCLLASGSTYPAAVKPDPTRLSDRPERLQQYDDIRAKIGAASSFVVVGGGAVGVEVAAELAEACPGKKVTLVTPSGLVERMDAKAQAFAAEWLEQHGVEVLNDRVSDWGGLGDGEPAAATLAMASGRTLQADLVFKCVGVKPATGSYAASLSPVQLAPSGAVAVEPTLQVVGWRNVFAAGDVSGAKEEKTAAMAGLAGRAAALNILALDQGRELQRWPDGLIGAEVAPLVSGFTLGTKAGVIQMGSDVKTGGLPAMAKSLVSWLSVRVAGGSRFWAWVYRQMTNQMVAGLKKDARKAAAAAAETAAAETAAA